MSDAGRRDRLWLLNAFAVVLLTLLGAAGEALGIIDTSRPTHKRRTHSLFRQGCISVGTRRSPLRISSAPTLVPA